MHELYHKYIIMHLYLQKYRVKKRFSLCDKIAEINEKKISQLFCSFGMFGVFFFVLVGSWCSNSSISNFLNISIWMCMWLFHVVTIGTFKIYLFWWFWEECLNLMLIVHLSYILIRHTFDIQSWSVKLMF